MQESWGIIVLKALPQPPEEQSFANLGAQTIRKAGRRNADGNSVLDVPHVQQDGFREVTSCFCDGIMYSATCQLCVFVDANYLHQSKVGSRESINLHCAGQPAKHRFMHRSESFVEACT